jgi:CheY-like chemotaxis protein
MSPVITLVDDLMFLSRIREAARGSGVSVRSAANATDLVGAARDGGRLVLVDADSARLRWEEAVGALRAEPSLADLPVIAFLSHVRDDRAEAARAAGCSRVLSRSAFVRELPRLLATATVPATLEENDR